VLPKTTAKMKAPKLGKYMYKKKEMVCFVLVQNVLFNPYRKYSGGTMVQR